MTKERDIESYFVGQWEAIGGETRKMRWIGRRDAPDRFAAILGWNGLIEFKRPKKKPRATQQNEIDKLVAIGVNIEVLDTFDKVNIFIAKNQRRNKKYLSTARFSDIV